MKNKRNIVVLLAVLVMVSGLLAGYIKEKKRLPQNENPASQAGDELTGTKVRFSNDINTDILTRHALPKFERMEAKDRKKLVDSLQVMKKIELLQIEKAAFLYPEKNLQNTEQSIASLCAEDLNGEITVDFNGTRADELVETMNANPGAVINIISEYIELNCDIPLINNIHIIGNGVEFICKENTNAIFGENISNVWIDNIKMEGNAKYGIFLLGGENVRITNCTINCMEEKAICISGKLKGFQISNNVLNENGAGGVYLSGEVSDGLIENNQICGNRGTSNWMAGIVMTNVVSEDRGNIWETFDQAHHFPRKENLYGNLACPHNIILRDNEVSHNNASGIYSDGAYNCFVIGNKVEENDKEGICLDYGTIGFYLKENIFDGNGQRIRQTDEDLRMDFVLDAGRMEDGSAKAKLPGISLDNTAYNILENNIVINNYGGGIKMVRTTVRCLISENIVKDNNRGKNDVFHFFGIEAGAAVADVESKDMDFTPDYENIICRNSITGDHYSGIFVGENCYVNDIFDNVIMEPQMFAVEAISVRFNSIVNNLSNAGIRNEYRE